MQRFGATECAAIGFFGSDAGTHLPIITLPLPLVSSPLYRVMLTFPWVLARSRLIRRCLIIHLSVTDHAHRKRQKLRKSNAHPRRLILGGALRSEGLLSAGWCGAALSLAEQEVWLNSLYLQWPVHSPHLLSVSG